ncbi:MAG: RNA methyltransferase [Candidatus Kapaibacterium sp.]
MMTPVTITSLDDPRIQAYRSLEGTPVRHTKERIFIAEGRKVTTSLLESTLQVESVFALPKYYQALTKLIESKNIPNSFLYTADPSIMDRIVGFRLHEGVMAIGRQPEPIPLSALTFPIVALAGVVNSENVGAIMRNCAAFGIKSIIVDAATSSPYLRRSVRVSMGAVFSLDIQYADSIIEIVDELRANAACSVISAEITPDSLPLPSFVFPEQSVIIFGSEGNGISPSILEKSDAIVSVPITAITSINVAATSAIVLYHYQQHRGTSFIR